MINLDFFNKEIKHIGAFNGDYYLNIIRRDIPAIPYIKDMLLYFFSHSEKKFSLWLVLIIMNTANCRGQPYPKSQE